MALFRKRRERGHENIFPLDPSFFRFYLQLVRDVWNRIGHIDEKALENMSYVLRISENIKINSDATESESEMCKYFPYFYWVLRDFSLDLKGKTEKYH